MLAMRGSRRPRADTSFFLMMMRLQDQDGCRVCWRRHATTRRISSWVRCAHSFLAELSSRDTQKRSTKRDARVPTGSVVQSGGIGNALLLRDRCFAAAVPFDPKLGLSGGEDALFLGRLRDQGRKCVWCAEAAVSEIISADRLEPAYLLRRAFRGGQTTAYVPSALDHPRWQLVLRWMAIGTAQVCLYGPWGVVLRLCGRDEWLSAMAKAASGLGKLLWHPALHIRNYRLDLISKPASGPRRS